MELNKSNKRKVVIVSCMLTFLLLASICYYLFYSFINNGATANLCKNIHCLAVLSLAEFLSISTGLFALFWVIDSLNSWKDQDAYYNSRDINLELSEYIYTCDIGIIMKIMKLPKNLPFEEMRDNLKVILPSCGVGSPISNLCYKIEHENIYYHKELKELSELVQKIIFSIRNVVDREKVSFKNIDSRIRIAIRTDVKRAKQLSDKLQDKLYDLVNR